MKIRTRLYVEELVANRPLILTDKPHHYLKNVLRCARGEGLEVFNGRDGAWHAEIVAIGKRQSELALHTHIAAPTPLPDIWVLFAPLRRARLAYMAQKATEMGAARLCPVQTARMQGGRARGLAETLRANAIEAAEQCGLRAIPAIDPLRPLADMLADWQKIAPERALIFCDAAARPDDAARVLSACAPPAALLIGPEGGFTAEEAASLRAHASVRAIGLGPRILRADTALVAALALAQIYFGDWRNGATKANIAK